MIRAFSRRIISFAYDVHKKLIRVKFNNNEIYLYASADVTIYIYYKPVIDHIYESTYSYLIILTKRVEKLAEGYQVPGPQAHHVYIYIHISIKAIYDCGHTATRGINPGSAVS